MSDTVTGASAVPEPTYGPSARVITPPAPAPASDQQSSAPDPADLRLVIEDDQQAGCYVYKTIDWRTGEVVQQVPREQVVKMREAYDYVPGAVIKSQA